MVVVAAMWPPCLKGAYVANMSEAAKRSRKAYEKKRKLRQQRDTAEAKFQEMSGSGFNGMVMGGIVAAWSGTPAHMNVPVQVYSHTTKLEAAGMPNEDTCTVVLEIGGKLVRITVDTPGQRGVNDTHGPTHKVTPARR